MKTLFTEACERQRMELYCEYLKKIPQLLAQLASVEDMYEKAVTEEEMLTRQDPESVSTGLYAARLASTRDQCLSRAEDIKDQLRLIFGLKAELEEKSPALKELAGKDDPVSSLMAQVKEAAAALPKAEAGKKPAKRRKITGVKP